MMFNERCKGSELQSGKDAKGFCIDTLQRLTHF